MIKKLFSKIIQSKTGNIIYQFFRYFFAGGTAFIVDFSLMIILKEFAGLHYLAAATVSFLVALFVNYLISVNWVFNIHKRNKVSYELIIFLTTGAIGLLINDGVIWALREKINIDYRIAKLIATCIAFFWNFLSRKIILFNKFEAKNENK